MYFIFFDAFKVLKLKQLNLILIKNEIEFAKKIINYIETGLVKKNPPLLMLLLNFKVITQSASNEIDEALASLERLCRSDTTDKINKPVFKTTVSGLISAIFS